MMQCGHQLGTNLQIRTCLHGNLPARRFTKRSPLVHRHGLLASMASHERTRVGAQERRTKKHRGCLCRSDQAVAVAPPTADSIIIDVGTEQVRGTKPMASLQAMPGKRLGLTQILKLTPTDQAGDWRGRASGEWRSAADCWGNGTMRVSLGHSPCTARMHSSLQHLHALPCRWCMPQPAAARSPSATAPLCPCKSTTRSASAPPDAPGMLSHMLTHTIVLHTCMRVLSFQGRPNLPSCSFDPGAGSQLHGLL